MMIDYGIDMGGARPSHLCFVSQRYLLQILFFADFVILG
jgi:hypothetical protein